MKHIRILAKLQLKLRIMRVQTNLGKGLNEPGSLIN